MRHDAALARLAAAQIGLATTKQAIDEGLSRSALARRREAGLLVPTGHRGVLRHAAVPFTERTKLQAAVLACGPAAVASHRSAGMLHGFEVRRFRPEVTVCDTTMPKAHGIAVHRTNRLDPLDVRVVDRIPCTSRARTALDLGAVLPWEVYEEVLQVAVITKRLSFVDLVAVLERLGGKGRRGAAKLRAFLRYSVPDSRLASLLELLVLEVVRELSAREPVLQHELVCIDGRVVVLDMAWPDERIAVEANGHRWHATRKQLDDDEARRRSIRASGYAYDAFTWSDVHEHRERTKVELARSLSPLLL